MFYVPNGSDYAIGVCDSGVCDVFVLEYECVRHFLVVGFLDLTDVYMVVVCGGLEVPAIDCVIIQGGTCVGLLVYWYGASHQAKGHSVVVEGSEH